MSTLAWLHNLSPFLVEFGNGVGIRWYGLSYAAGFAAGWWIMQRLSRRGVTPLSPQRVTDMMLALVAGVVVGGRLGYCVFYQRELFASLAPSFPWWGVLRLNDGGMSSHGGMIGVALAAWWIARGPRAPDGTRPRRVPLLHVMDLVALACTPGLFFGRLANFVNGELLGEIVAPPGRPAPWWAVKFPQERLDWWYRDPGPPGQPRGHAPALSPEQESTLHRLIEQFRMPGDDDPAAYERLLRFIQSGKQGAADAARQLEPLIAARHPSQLYQAVAEGIVVGLVLLLAWRKPRTPGVIGALFLLCYGVLRILTELIRLPDSQLAQQRFMHLSRGQWLSVGMILAAGGLYAAARRWGGPKMRGWG
jgi:phosphatidylglycerol:prolipoprotein diacylglycerol transferase